MENQPRTSGSAAFYVSLMRHGPVEVTNVSQLNASELVECTLRRKPTSAQGLDALR
jgi:hypothetical protein